MAGFLVPVRRLPHDVGKIFPPETLGEDVGSGEFQTELDVLRHPRRGGRRQRQNRHRREELPNFGNSEVRRAEIIAPLGNAVRLIHRQQGDLHRLQTLPEVSGRQAFGRDVEEFHLAGLRFVQGGFRVVGEHAGVDGLRPDAPLVQILDLVLHQGDEGRDDEAKSPAHKPRYLVCDGLPSAGRHKSERVPAGEDGADDVLLQRTEIVVAPIAL